MRSKISKHAILFAIGGVCYYVTEVLARGYSHWTMFLVGGLCFIIIGGLNERTPKVPIVRQMMMSMIMVVTVEFIAGCVLNLWLGLNVWDYSGRPFNLLGQVCLRNTMYWLFLSAPAIVLDDYLRYWLFGEDRPSYKIF